MNIYSSLVLYLILFTIIFLMHKPFNIHKYQQKWVKILHRTSEIICYIWTIILFIQITLFIIKNF